MLPLNLCCRGYLLEPACIPSPASANSKESFCPWKRIAAKELDPLSFVRVTAASSAAGVCSSTMCAGAFATTFLPCRMLSSTSGPVPSHWTLYSPAFSVVPLTVTGWLSCKLALVPAKALEANSNASPNTRHLRYGHCRELHDCSFFFPEITSGNGWGGPVHDFREKTLVFCRESPTMHPLGFSGQAARPVALRMGVFSPGPPNRE